MTPSKSHKVVSVVCHCTECSYADRRYRMLCVVMLSAICTECRYRMLRVVMLSAIYAECRYRMLCVSLC
jgi:hypothetical protein